MHGQSLRSLLDEYTSAEEHQVCTKAAFVQFINRHTDCFHRSCETGHLTGSACITDPQRSQMILVHHKKLDMWLQPGGHADGNSDLLSVARQEAIEETGMSELVAVSEKIFDLDIHLIPQFGDTAAHYHYDVRFHFAADPQLLPVASIESHEVRWVPFTKIANFTQEDSILRMIRKLSR